MRTLRLTANYDVLQFALESWERDPEVRIEDAYKWLFHATLGGEHAIQNPDGPRRWLDREWDSLAEPTEVEPMRIDLLRNGSLVRLNLRPYKAQNGSKDKLLCAFISSASSFRGKKDSFVDVWKMLGVRLQTRPIRHLRREDWDELEALTKEKGYPAIDHSPAYLALMQPAYRVLTKQDASRLLDGQGASD